MGCMSNLFDRAFFRFLGGFIAILIVSFLLLLVAGNYELRKSGEAALDQTEE